MALGPGRFAGVVRDVASTTAQRGFPSRRASGIGGTGFVPTHLPGCELWLDAADTDTITSSSGAVSQWNDKSGFGRNVSQATSSAQPATGTATQNGLNVVLFTSATAQVLQTASSISAQPSTVVVAARLTTTTLAASSFTTLHDGGSGGTARNTTYMSTGSGGFVEIFAGSSLRTFSGSLDTNWHLYFALFRDTQSTAYRDGGAGTTGSAGTQGLTAGFSIGGRFNNNTEGWRGEIAECCVFSRILTNGEINALGRYLVAKWAITWTPAT